MSLMVVYVTTFSKGTGVKSFSYRIFLSSIPEAASLGDSMQFNQQPLLGRTFSVTI